MLILPTRLQKVSTNCRSAHSRENLAKHSFSGISDGKNTEERTKAFYCPVYMKVYVWILKILYMWTNLWQNILCKAQYLKLQYFWFLKQDKKEETYQKDFKTFALHRVRGRFKVSSGWFCSPEHVLTCRYRPVVLDRKWIWTHLNRGSCWRLWEKRWIQSSSIIQLLW